MLGAADEDVAFVPPPVRVQLRPGMAGAAFSQSVGQDGFSNYACDALPDLGLALDADDGRITGTPLAAGEHDLTVTAIRGTTPVTLAVQLIVNADPKSLWREVEPPADAPHPKPHADTLHIDGDLRIVGASKRGRSHAHAGSFREDHAHARAVGPWRLLAVADGAGSAALSRLGSRIAVDTALDALQANLPNDDDIAPALLAAAHAAAHALDDRAAADSIDRRALSTTLILAAVRRVEAGILTAVVGVGDGGAGIVDVTRTELTTLTTPDNGEFAGQTRFLDASVTADRVRVDVRPAYSALLLMTDGITNPKLPTDASFAEYDAWAALWREVEPSLDDLPAWLDFWSHGNHDDRTLLVLMP